MSGPPAGMDWCSAPRLMLVLMTMCLLLYPNNVCLHGYHITDVKHNLHCVNDYLLTINCSLSIAPSEDAPDSSSSYWLTFRDSYEDEMLFVCRLIYTGGDYFCSVRKADPTPEGYYAESFSEIDLFEIRLCHSQNNGPESCDLLVKEYTPVTNIKPNAPCCLSVSVNSSRSHFTWKSTYEEHGPFTALAYNLNYQLHYYKRGDKHNVVSHEISTIVTTFSMDDQNLAPDTEYSARVRTCPNQVFYKGECSGWSSEVHWKMDSPVTDPPSNPLVFGLAKVFIPLCVLVPVLLLLCYGPIKQWRKSAFIPTPAPYFHTLYSDFQGDFKSWVVTKDKMTDMLKAEETLQIYTLTKCVDIQEEECLPQIHHHHFQEGSTYSNLTDPGYDVSLLGIPYAVSTMAPPSAPGNSLKSLTFSSQPGSPTEGDSGCWLCSQTSLERDAPFYCNEYCTLSSFQQGSLVTAEHQGSPTRMSSMDDIAQV